MVLHVPHASARIPPDVRDALLLSEAELITELGRMTDSGTEVLAVAAAERSELAPWVFVNELSRLVVDPERFPDEREEMRHVGMGAVYTRTSHGAALRHGAAAEEQHLLTSYFQPYADAVAELVQDRLTATGHAVIVDVHSFPSQALPYELHGQDRRPQVCLGTDEQHTPPWLAAEAGRAFAGFDVALNEPFRGTYVPARHYGSDLRVSSVMVEVRRDVPPDSDAVVMALAALVDAVSQRTRPPPAR